MYPFIRLVTTAIHAVFSRPLPVDGVCETRFTCMPWDIDMFMEMNNGRILTLYDLGRFCLAIRMGLANTLRKNGWGLVVAGGSVRYRRRIRMFERVTMRTRVLGYEDRWFYIEQSMWVKGKPASAVLLRTAVTQKTGTVYSDEVVKALGQAGWNPELPEWVGAWIDADAGRAWPPS